MNNLNRNQVASLFSEKPTPEDIEMFVSYCEATGLNPFARQIIPMMQWDKRAGKYKLTPVVSIDGYRVIADRSGKYGGQTPYQWCGEDGKWKDVWLSKEPPSAARVGVIRTDFEQPVFGVVTWAEKAKYTSNGSLMYNWKEMPTTMLAKCAESAALRRAFPMQLSGLYTDDEIIQESQSVSDVDNFVNTVDTQEVSTITVSDQQLEVPLFKLPEDVYDWASKHFGFDSEQVKTSLKGCGVTGVKPDASLRIAQCLADVFLTKQSQPEPIETELQSTVEDEDF